MKFELALTLLLFLLLFLKIDGRANNVSVIRITNVFLLLNLVLGFFGNEPTEIFGGMYRTSSLLAIEKSVLNLAVLLISFFSYDWLKNHKHLPEFFMLLVSSLMGFFFMLSSGNLLMFFLGLELSTIPLAALCNFDLEKKVSGEAAMKMIMSSAFSSAILLFGISLIYGSTGTLQFAQIPYMLTGSQMQLLGFVLIFSGFAFKLSVVPFHLWTADVYEGSPVAVTAYLSVVSKGAMAFVFITTLYAVFGAMAMTWYYMLAVSAAITITLGNIFALRQQNLKRFFAFSSIAQVGYLLIAISSATQIGVASVVYFILIYVFTNLAAFAIISVISSQTGKETLNDYKGLYASNPTLALVMSLALFSLAGVPPTAGFFGKLFLLTTGAQVGSWWLIIVAALNLMVSLYYYLRIVRVMFVDESSEPLPKLNLTSTAFAAVSLCVAGILILGFVSRTFDVIFQHAANL
ncbi:MAG: NADH-quinone oxidoreductase subunit N [Chitinophagales bacterium]|nr:NADH-quinone oxidoreductase subunit N [Chitinophagales bacterium]